MQERLLERQRVLATNLKIEDVELEARRELQRAEHRLVLSVRTEGLLDQAHKAFGRAPDIRLSDQRYLRPVRTHDRGAETEANIDRVGEH